MRECLLVASQVRAQPAAELPKREHADGEADWPDESGAPAHLKPLQLPALAQCTCLMLVRAFGVAQATPGAVKETAVAGSRAGYPPFVQRARACMC